MYPFSPAFANFPPLSRSYAPVLSFPSRFSLSPSLPKARYRHFRPIIVLYLPRQPLPKARYRHFRLIIVLYLPRQSLPKARYRHFCPIIVLYNNTLSKKRFTKSAKTALYGPARPFFQINVSFLMKRISFIIFVIDY